MKIWQNLLNSAESEDYATMPVSLAVRRKPLTMGLLWITMVTGFPTIIVGFAWYKAGFSLLQLIAASSIACLIVVAYGIPATYLGSKSGLTWARLARLVFGHWGSYLVSLNFTWVNTGWYALNAIFLAESLNGLYHFSLSPMYIAGILAVLMAFNNFFGFSGVANFARYLAAPVLIAWVAYVFAKAGVACPPSVFQEPAHASFAQALLIVSTLVVGFGVWGNEPDYWRYGKPGLWKSVIPFVVAIAIGEIMFPVVGWMLARLSGVTEPGAAVNFMNQYAFGGITAIAAFVLTVTYFASNDANLYGSINALQNILGTKRRLVVIILTIASAFTAMWLSGNGKAFEDVASVSSVMLPSVTVIMMAEWFWLKRLSPAGEDCFSATEYEHIPNARWAAIIALVAGSVVGVATSGLIPGLDVLHMGICSLQSWLTCLLVYVLLRFAETWHAERTGFPFADQALPTVNVSVSDEPTNHG